MDFHPVIRPSPTPNPRVHDPIPAPLLMHNSMAEKVLLPSFMVTKASPKIAVHTLYKIFRKFGTIRSISRVDAKSVKICFMSTESMDKLKNIRRMSIGKHRIQIRWLGDSSKQQRSSHKEFSVKTFTVTNVPLKVSLNKLYNALNQYGQVRDIRRNGTVVIARFMPYQSMNKLRRSLLIEIEGYYYEVRRTDDTYIKCIPDEYDEGTALEEAQHFDAPLNILNALPDEMLHEIFKSDVLDLCDLITVASVCTRFNRIFKEIRSIENKTTLGDRLDIVFHNDRLYDNNLRLLFRLNQYYQICGASITSVDLNRLPHQQVLYGILMEHCPNLTSLKCQVDDRWTIYELRSITSKMKELHLTLGPKVVHYLSKLLDGNSSLEILELNTGNERLIFPNICLPNLIDLRLSRVRIHEESTKAFLMRHPLLQRFTVHDSQIFDCPRFGDLLVPLSNVKEFSCIYYQRLFHNSYKKRRYGNRPIDIRDCIQTLISNKAPLEKLVIKHADGISSSINSICQMTSIKHLDITVDYPDEIRKLVQSLVNLNEIKVEGESLTSQDISDALSQASEKLSKASFYVQRLWDDDHIMGTENDLFELQRFAENSGIDVDITMKALFGALMGEAIFSRKFSDWSAIKNF